MPDFEGNDMTKRIEAPPPEETPVWVGWLSLLVLFLVVLFFVYLETGGFHGWL